MELDRECTVKFPSEEQTKPLAGGASFTTEEALHLAGQGQPVGGLALPSARPALTYGRQTLPHARPAYHFTGQAPSFSSDTFVPTGFPQTWASPAVPFRSPAFSLMTPSSRAVPYFTHQAQCTCTCGKVMQKSYPSQVGSRCDSCLAFWCFVGRCRTVTKKWEYTLGHIQRNHPSLPYGICRNCGHAKPRSGNNTHGRCHQCGILYCMKPDCHFETEYGQISRHTATHKDYFKP